MLPLGLLVAAVRGASGGFLWGVALGRGGPWRVSPPVRVLRQVFSSLRVKVCRMTRTNREVHRIFRLKRA